jgi:hypothetical protein
MRPRTWRALVLILAGCPAVASAQALPKVFVAGGAGTNVSTNDFAMNIAFPLYQETANISGPVAVGRGTRFELQAGVRLRRRVGVGVTLSSFRSSGTIQATYSLPSPFLFDHPQTATTDASSRRRTTDVHVQVLWLAYARKPWSVIAFGGPTLSWLSQELATDRLTYAYTYPFDSISLASTALGSTHGNGLGGHVGATVSRQVGRHVGLDGQIRWSTTRVSLTAESSTFTLQTGGIQMGGGLRIFY